MTNRLYLCGAILLAMLVEPTFALGQSNNEVALQAQLVLRQHCSRCHSGPNSEGGDFDVLDVGSLLKDKLITPSDPDKSYLLQRMVRNEMPPRAIQARPKDADHEAIRKWIEAGAKPFPTPKERVFVRYTKLLEHANEHVNKLIAEGRNPATIRFFTLHQVHNTPTIPSRDLKVYRAALSKTVNSLSWQPKMVLPVAVDPQEILFAVDLSELKWGRKQWQKILAQYPYGGRWPGLPLKLRAVEAALENLTQTDLPIIRGDWFIATALRPPLYYDLLELPTTYAELANQLKVEPLARFLSPRPQDVVRAAFPKSGVSSQNRCVDWFRASVPGRADADFWVSYDFKPNTKRANLFRFPLGPLDLFAKNRHPFELQAFDHDGGEMIFTLPNGLDAYFLTDGDGNRITAGPIDVVDDPTQTSGTPEIVAGISCIACHRRGVIPFEDFVRDHSAVKGRAAEHIEKLYGTKDVFQKRFERHRKRYQKAVEATIDPVLAPAKASELFDSVEPISQVALWHGQVYLDLKAVSIEFDFKKPEKFLQKIGEENLKSLGLGALLKGGVVSRSQWEATEGVSVMQEVFSAIGGIPVNPIAQ